MPNARTQTAPVAPEFPVVDYDTHPAFASEFKRSPQLDEYFALAMKQVDARLADFLHSAKKPSLGKIESFLKAEITPQLERIADALVKAPGIDPMLRDIAAQSVIKAGNQLAFLLQFQTHQASVKAPKGFSSVVERIRAGLQTHGVHVGSVPKQSIDEIKSASQDHLQTLRARSAKNPNRCAVAEPMAGAFWDKILSVVEGAGLIDAASHYIGQKMAPCHVAFMLSNDREVWWKDCYGDLGLPTTKLSYLHTDGADDVVKIIFYLSDVTENHGPFTYIPGSPHWQRSPLQTHFSREFDEAVYVAWSKRLRGDSPYYRRTFQDPEFRKAFHTLPKCFQITTHFGDDLPDGGAQAQALLNLENRLVGEVGTYVIFHGGRLLHRGGSVERGERLVLQVGLSLYRDPDQRSKARRFLANQLRTLLGGNAVDRFKKLFGR